MQQLLLVSAIAAVLLLGCSSASSVCEVDTDISACIRLSRGTGCGCVSSGTKAKCCHFQLKLIDNYYEPCGLPSPTELTALFLFNCTTDDGQSVRSLDLTLLAKKYPNLTTLAVNGADYRTINIDTEMSQSGKLFSELQCLNVSNNILDNSTAISRVIEAIPSLKSIDMSHNNISYVPNITRQEHFSVYLENNKNLKCDGIEDLMLRNFTQFMNPAQTECLRSVNLTQWAGDTIKMNLSSIVSTNMISAHCPKKCACVVSRITGDGRNSVSVNCTAKGLSELPSNLPEYTSELDISLNRIKDLSMLARNESYKHVTRLIADGNLIEDLQVLEGSNFINNFHHLSLQGNKINKIPYFMNKITQGSHQIRLSGNRFSCKCGMANNFKGFLVQQEAHIHDINQIMCYNMEGIKVMDVGEQDVCTKTDAINYIYYIITAEVLLLVLLVAKVSYDYWVFKNAGYLPWPASKMPRLPCDCVLVK